MDLARPLPPQGFPGLGANDVQRLGAGDVLVFDGVLGMERALAVAGALTAEPERLAPAAIGSGARRTRHPVIRGDRTRWLEPTREPPESALWDVFESLRGELCRAAWLAVSALEVQLALYPGAGERYAAHCDSPSDRDRRRVTATYYLNAGWSPGDGGELEVDTPDGTCTLAPVLDRLAVFRSLGVRHAVLPVRAPRWAVTAWYLGPGAPASF